MYIEAPFMRWFSSDGLFVASPFQQWLASEIPIVRKADSKKNPTSKPEGGPLKDDMGATPAKTTRAKMGKQRN